MVFDLEMIRLKYEALDEKVRSIRKNLNKPLTLTEKILYSHSAENKIKTAYKRGSDYVYFHPDRVAMQDATAQMALLQFMQAGKNKVAVPSTVHCDHLIQAKSGAAEDLKSANQSNEEVLISYLKSQANMALVSGNRVPESFIRLCSKTMLFPEG
jgi:aconitate hydratase